MSTKHNPAKSGVAASALRIAPPTPEATLALTLPFAAVIEALATSPQLLDELAHRVASLLNEDSAGKAGACERHERLTVAEAAKYLCCKNRRVYDLTSQGRLIPLKEGGKSLYERAELDRHLGIAGYEREQRRRERYEQRVDDLRGT